MEDGQISGMAVVITNSRSRSRSRSRSKSKSKSKSRSRSRSRSKSPVVAVAENPLPTVTSSRKSRRSRSRSPRPSHHQHQQQPYRRRRRSVSPNHRRTYQQQQQPRPDDWTGTLLLQEHLPYKNDPPRQKQFVRFMMQHMQTAFETQEQERNPILCAIEYCLDEIRRVMADFKAKSDKIVMQYGLSDQECRSHFSTQQTRLRCYVNPPDHKILYQYYGKQLLLDRAPIMFWCSDVEAVSTTTSSTPIWRNDVIESVSFAATIKDLRKLNLQIINQPGRYLLVAPAGGTPTEVHMNPSFQQHQHHHHTHNSSLLY